MMEKTIEIVEVSPRDGLQNEKLLVPAADKLELIRRAIAAGARCIEATSFVNPKRVPQMADAEEIMAGAPRGDGVRYAGLVLNLKGFERAMAAGCDEVNFAILATETFNRRNQGVSVADSLAAWREIASSARAAGVPATVTIGASFGCPFEGEVAPGRVLDLAMRALEAGPAELAFADTIGCGVPSQVEFLLGAVRAAEAGVRLRCHFHNTRGTALANVLAAVQSGVHAIDSSIAGLGGCPFAPAATGNVATEDVVYMLERMDLRTGFDLARLIDTAGWINERLSRTPASALAKAGSFPLAPTAQICV